MMADNHPRYIPALRFALLTGFYDPVLRLTMREGTIKRGLLAQAVAAPATESSTWAAAPAP